MRKVLLSSALIVLVGFASSAQSVLKGKSSNLAVTIKLFDTAFTTADSVKFLMTVTNLSNSTQKILFDKPLKYYPWSTSVILSRKSGQTVKVTPWAFLSSKLYMENELKEFYRELKTGESINQVYYLKNVVRFDTKDGTLAKGTYKLRLNYDTNLSNIVAFTIK